MPETCVKGYVYQKTELCADQARKGTDQRDQCDIQLYFRDMFHSGPSCSHDLIVLIVIGACCIITLRVDFMLADKFFCRYIWVCPHQELGFSDCLLNDLCAGHVLSPASVLQYPHPDLPGASCSYVT